MKMVKPLVTVKNRVQEGVLLPLQSIEDGYVIAQFAEDAGYQLFDGQYELVEIDETTESTNKEYVKTYFRLDTPSYHFSSGWDEESKNNFDQEVIEILSSLGFEIKKPEYANYCCRAYRGLENLYCHPQNISGQIKKESITELEIALSQSKCFKLRNTDTYENVYDYTKEEVINILNKDHKEETIKIILKACATTRKNKYVHVEFNSSPIKTMDEKQGNAAYGEFVNGIIAELVEQGLLIKINSESEYYRALNKTELKLWEKQNGKLKIA